MQVRVIECVRGFWETAIAETLEKIKELPIFKLRRINGGGCKWLKKEKIVVKLDVNAQITGNELKRV